ncbi:MBL fold metallo-hydrolase [Celerinatantimonas yamalensis]
MSYQIIPVTPFAQNCSLIWCDKTRQAALIDPGGDADKLIAAVKNQNVELTYILLTHGHLDHVGVAKVLAQHYNVPIWGPHLADKFWFDNLQQQCQMFGFEPVATFIPDKWLSQGEKVTIGLVELDVRVCAGHTPGHVVFIDHQQHLAWVGDVLFHRSIGRTDFPKGSFEDLIQSIRKELLVLDDDYLFIPGHGPTSTIGDERAHNPFIQ